MIGETLGPYRVLAKLGEGGMGEVYRARDTQLKRDVALKVLPADVAADPERLTRFQREAELLAALNHPHIAQIHGLVDADGVRALVMELVEGATLAERIARGAVPLDEALPIATQLAEALEYAHERGIVHRDLKPANIKLTPDGAVKVLDFGLAKALDPVAVAPAGPAADPLANSPTMTSPVMTRMGIILGTAAYMSPEQARGKPADKRSDIWAFGVVLFEMLTGRAAFPGETIADVLGAIVHKDPDWSALPAATPPLVRRLLARCLTKDPKQRLHDIADARLEIEESASPSAASTPARARAGWWRLSPIAAVLALAVAAVAFLAGWLATRPAAPPPKKPMRVALDVGTPDDAVPVVVTGAPDASGFAYCGVQGGLWVHRWDRLGAERIPGPDGGCYAVAFSPDGRQLAVMDVPANLRIVSATDNAAPARSLSVNGLGDFAFGGALDWASDGNIYAAGATGNLLRVSPVDGHSVIVAKPDSRTWLLVGLDVLPESRAAVVVAVPRAAVDWRDLRIGVAKFETGTVEVLDLLGVAARYMKPGYLVIAHDDGSLAAVPFDVKSLRPSGSAIPLPSDRTGVLPQWFQGQIDVTDDGTLLYWASRAGDLAHPVFVDLHGTPQPSGAPWNDRFRMPRLVSGDSMLAVEVTSRTSTQVYARDWRSGRTENLTSDGSINRAVFWNPDDRALTIVSDRSDRSGAGALYRRRLGGGGLEALPKYDPRPIFDAAWSKDGRWLVLRTDDSAPGKADILAVRPALESVARPIAASPNFSEYSPALSPDSEWLAYVTNETDTGRYEVVVTPFPDGRARWQISSPNGGSAPLWSHTGRELFYVSDGQMMAAQIAPGPDFRVIGQRPLFSMAPYVQWNPLYRNFDIDSKDRRFLMLQRNDNVPSRIVTVYNWTSELASLAKR